MINGKPKYITGFPHISTTSFTLIITGICCLHVAMSFNMTDGVI